MAERLRNPPSADVLTDVLSACSHIEARTPQEVHDECAYGYSVVQQTLSYAASAGLLQPVHVNPDGWVPTSSVRYRLTVGGEERLREVRGGVGGR